MREKVLKRNGLIPSNEGHITYRKIILVLLLTTICMSALSSFWWEPNRGIRIDFDALQNKNLTYRIFYTTGPNQVFEAKKSIPILSKKGRNHYSVYLPAERIYRFRFDFGRNPGDVSLINLKITGEKTIPINTLAPFRTVNLEADQPNKQIKIKSFEPNPIAVIDSLNLSAGRSIGLYFISCLAVFLCISYQLVFYIGKFRMSESVFLCLFFLILFTPLSKINQEDISSNENRAMAKFPSLYTGGGYFNEKFGNEFNYWFSDRFNGRQMLLDIFDYVFFSERGNERVLIGQDNWLFQTASLRDFNKTIFYSQRTMEIGAQYLQDINDWCKKNNIQFYYVNPPAKIRIYPEYFRLAYPINRGKKDRYRVWEEYVKKHTDVCFIPLYDVLRRSKDNGLLYYKNDTHWTRLGAYYGYLEIMRVINEKGNNIPVYCPTGFLYKTQPIGDLTRMYHALKEDQHTLYKEPILSDRGIPYNRNDAHSIKKKRGKRLVIFRDSFAHALAPYLNESFKEVHYFWRWNLRPEDLEYIRQHADVLIFEGVGFAPCTFPIK